ncbi:unnamed protein product [Pylaiella littoralis]
MPFRDRFLCWLIMLRQGNHFREIKVLFGPSASTFNRDLWMTIQAQTCEFLNNEVSWPDADERMLQRDWLSAAVHPAFADEAYIADGTKAAEMRNPVKTRKEVLSQHTQVHNKHYSHNNGLGWSHIIYTNFRGMIIRVETIDGRLSDRAAHVASRLFQHPEKFLSPWERGMGDGNYQGLAKIDDGALLMCVPYRKSVNLTP